MLLHRLSVWLFKWLIEGDFRVLPRAFDLVLHAGEARNTVTDQFVDQEQPGFWEQNGFHLHADPFAEQRFSGDELDIAEDAWLEKAFD